MPATNTATLSATLTPTVVAGTYPNAASQVAWKPASLSFGSGTTPGNIDLIYQAQLTATTGGISIQLNASSLVDPVGDAVSFVRLDGLAITNTGANTVTLTGAALTSIYGAAASIVLAPGGVFLHSPGAASANGLVVGTTTSSVLTLTATGASSTVQVCAVGRSV